MCVCMRDMFVRVGYLEEGTRVLQVLTQVRHQSSHGRHQLVRSEGQHTTSTPTSLEMTIT